MKSWKLVGLFLGALITSTAAVRCQTPPQIIGIAQTDEQAIRLTWTSISNEVYQIQSAGTLIDTNTGTTPWQILYDEYPSQGTNTFWTDHGNYFDSPPILDPRFMPMRFYQVVDVGPDTTSDEPAVSITSPTNGLTTAGELTVTVVAYTDQATLSTKLYVDGQEMPPSVDSTNWVDDTGVTNYEADTYSINTSEWFSETHILFATAECQSGYGDAVNSPPVATGHAVSPFVRLSFSNLVERILFSQSSFDPSAGQTQQVSAVFAANVNWTLEIRDINSNEVRTATGSGPSMLFNWNGDGDGGTNLPTGVYYYYISAQTNGQALLSPGGGDSDASSFSTLSGLDSGNSTELWAMPADGSGSAVPLALYPPGADTNDLTIFEAPQTWGQAQRASPSSAQFSSFADGSGGGATPEGSGASSSQTAAPAPQRPPTNPILGISGLCGVAYDTYSADGTNGFSVSPLPDGTGIPGSYIHLQGSPGTASFGYAPLPGYKAQANNFTYEMQLFGWRNKINKVDSTLSISDLIGSGTPFNQVSLGVLMSHGTYGTSQDYTAGLCEQMYFPITSGSSAQYLRMSQMNLGGSDPTNGLKWFAICACNSLRQQNWNSMQSAGIKPYNGNLHLLLGSDSIIYSSSVLLEKWALYMNYGRGSFSPMTVHDAWYQAAKDAYRGHNYANTQLFAIAGDSACMGDYVQSGYNSSPQGTWAYGSLQVWP